MKLLLVPVFVVFAVGACKGGGPDMPPAAEFPAMGEPAKMKIASPGQNGQVLRFKAKADSATRTKMSLDLSMDISAGGQSMDMTMAMGMDMQNRIEKVESDGVFTMKTIVENATAKVGGAMAAQIPSGALDGFGDMMKGDLMTMTIGPNGAVKSMEEAGSNPMMEQFSAGMDQAMKGGVVSLPDEAIGVGAKWDALMTVDMKGAKVQMATSYELLELNGSKAKIGMKIGGRANDQHMDMGMGSAKIEKLGIVASGSFDIDLENPTWAKGTLDMTLEMDIKVQDQSGSATMKMKMSATPQG